MKSARLLRATVVSTAFAAAAAFGASAALFSSYQPLTLQLKAPFNDLFLKARTDDEYTVRGVLSRNENGGDHAIGNVTVGLRGHTSVRETECSFPKLKLRFDTPPSDPAFAGLTSLKIGTHCGESQDGKLTPKFGRLPHEHSPLREGFVYRLFDVLDVPALKARPARIAYIYTDARAGESPDQNQPVVRNAMLLEETDDALKRVGAEKVIDEAAFTTAADELTPDDTARLTFAEALIGNFDWCLKFTPKDTYRCDARHPLWNVLALRVEGRTIPMIYDFDVSGMVAGHHAWFADVYNEAFVPSKSHAEIEVLGQLQRTRTLFARGVLDRTRARFNEKKDDAYRALEDAGLDPDGHRRIKEYVDAFYSAIGSDEAFYRPVVTASNTMPYLSPDRSAVACAARGAIPIGTPVSEPIDMQGDMIQVVLLDSLWHWAPPIKCAEIHKDAVWIERNAVSREFPK